MSNKILYIIIAVLLLLNIAQFVYFYSKDTDMRSELRILEYKNTLNTSSSQSSRKLTDEELMKKYNF